jgi:signal transduction histidine kinase
VSKGRLTRQELGWLLTQQAAGAAERLRKGVETLKTNVPPPPDSSTPDPGVGVDTTLAALDDAMKMLTTLHKAPVSVRGRRGRIDLASLLWEVAPEARVSMEPGSGTEVFGDEAELRRMLHVLVGHGAGSGSAVNVRRDGDFVRVGVVLGPDSSATAETERAWLSRMAIRYGGQHELEAGAEVLSLPADGVDERDEREALRKELDEARKQGEAYARELAQVFAHGEEPVSQSSYPPPLATPAAERLSTLVRMSGGIAASLRGMLSPVGRELAELRGAHGGHRSSPDLSDARTSELEERIETIRKRLLVVQDFIAELSSAGELDVEEAMAEHDLIEMTRAAARALDARVQRAGVEVRVVVAPEGAERASARVGGRAVAAMLRELIGHAVSATPRGGVVTITVGPHGAGESPMLGPRILVDDGGTSLPAPARRALLALEVEPGTYGRPSAVALYMAAEIVAYQGGTLDLADAPAQEIQAAGGDHMSLRAGVRVVVTFPR